MTKLAVGAYLARLRRAKGLTQVQAAEQIAARLPEKKLSPRMMNYYENGTYSPSVDVLMAFFEAIGGRMEDVQYLALREFGDAAAERGEGDAKARAWTASRGTSSDRLSAAADEAARIVAGLEAGGEADLASQYLGIGRRLLQNRASHETAHGA